MAKKSIAPPDDDDIDALIDRAVDTFFVEAPAIEELPDEQPVAQNKAVVNQEPEPSEMPSFEDAMDALFATGFEATGTQITSGDAETDRAIDLAVETLFVEESDLSIPETAQLEVSASQGPAQELDFNDEFIIEEATPKSVTSSRHTATVKTEQVTTVTPQHKSPQKERPVQPVAKPASPKNTPPQQQPHEVSYDDAMAIEIERHMHTLYGDKSKPKSVEKSAEKARDIATPSASLGGSPLRKLQEAILTLEWEISRRSITTLASELHKVRTKFQDNVIVDFAALAMRVVLDYIVKRMSKSHPESIRFLLEVTDYLDRSLKASIEDPLQSFHHILTRYEKYKSVVRRAEGLPDSSPAILNSLEIHDPKLFSEIVDSQSKTLMRAGRALAQRLPHTTDPQNLIRSFRFLVTRSINKVLENTMKEKPKKKAKTKPEQKSR
jgi:hypothetical protein